MARALPLLEAGITQARTLAEAQATWCEYQPLLHALSPGSLRQPDGPRTPRSRLSIRTQSPRKAIMADRAAANVCLANLTVALELAHAGIPIFPARITTRFNSWEKSPLVKRWQEAATTDEIQVRSWWKQFPVAVPGIELGRAGLVVIDPDRHGKAVDGVEAFAQLATDIGGLPVHPTTDTPSGHHHIFRQNGGEPLGNSPGGLPRSVDVRGNGGWIVGPGSVRSDGAVYRPHAGTPSLTQAYKVDTIPALPAALDAIIRQPDPGRVRERNTRPNRHGFVFHDG